MKGIGYRPTWAEINLDNLSYNFNQIKKIILPRTKIMVTVKADAYGHGLIPVAKRLVFCGVDYLGVASIDEALRLREAGIKLPILVLGVISKNDINALFKYKFTPTICSKDLVYTLNKKAGFLKRLINVHIKVDTGMGRLGVLYSDAFKLIKEVSKLKFINIEGVFTHLACADSHRQFTLYQLNLFNWLIEKISRANINVRFFHAANSIGLINFKNSHFNMVRPGLVIYGLYPVKNLRIKLKPVLSLKTRIVYYKKLPKGYGISYGHDYVTRDNTTVVNLPIGYGDGYPRNLSNKGLVLIQGKLFKISGRVCMDQIMVDVGNTKVRVGNEVVLIGSQGKSKITTEELAELSGTIPYEIVCGLGNRIPRLYTTRRCLTCCV